MAYVIKIKYENSLRRLVLSNEFRIEDFTFGKLETRIRELFLLPSNAEVSVTYTDRDGDVVTMANDADLKDALVHQSLNPLRLDATLLSSKGEGPNDVPKIEKEAVTVAEQGFKAPEIQSLRQLIQSYEPMYDKFASPAQARDFVENVLMQAITSRLVLEAETTATTTTTSKSPDPVGSSTGQENGKVGRVKSVTELPPASRDMSESESRKPETETQSTVASDVVHVGVTCDVCGISPIVGIRWKSLMKYNYDLCPRCFEKTGNLDDYTKIGQSMFRPRHLHPQRMMRMSTPVGRTFHTTGSGCYGSFRGGKPYGMRGGPFGARCNSATIPSVYGGKLDARFVRDVTMFDGTEVAPSTQFTKIWRLRNSGSVAWPAQTNLVHVGGDELGQLSMIPLEIPEQGLVPDGEIDVSVDLVAPQKPGRYVSHWRLASPYGPKFGHRVWVHIQVVPTESFVDHVNNLGFARELPTEFLVEHQNNLGFAQELPTESLDQSTSLAFAPVVANEAPQAENVTKQLECTFSFVNIDTASVETAIENTSDEAIDNKPLPPAMEVTMAASDSNLGNAFSMVYGPSSGVVGSAGIQALSAGKVARENFSKFDEEKGSAYNKDVTQNTTDVDVSLNGNFADSATGHGLVEDLYSPKGSVVQLEAMGFTDAKLNLELLEKNNFDLRKTLVDLCAVDEWDTILDELDEMGFHDTEMNRRLVYKNNGSVKGVVRDLVQMYKPFRRRRGNP